MPFLRGCLARRPALWQNRCDQFYALQELGASAFFTHAHWDLETTMTTFKNSIILWAHLEHSELR